jgi:hypothetical protein
MAIVHRVYKGDASGGPVDYSSIVATVTGTTYVGAALGTNSVTRFGVRAYDDVTLVEDDSVDAEVEIRVVSGADASNSPTPVQALRAVPLPSAAVRLDWTHDDGDPLRVPTGFKVYAGTPTVSYGSPLATVAYLGRGRPHTATLTGLTSGSAYQFAVRSYNAAGELAAVKVVTATPDSAAPPAVEGLVGDAVF